MTLNGVKRSLFRCHATTKEINMQQLISNFGVYAIVLGVMYIVVYFQSRSLASSLA